MTLSSRSPGPAGKGVVVVLGGTGFLGSDIVAAFLARGASVRAVARRPFDELHASRLEGAEVLAGDVEDPAMLERALEGASVVVHAVGCPFPAASNLDPVGDVERTLPGLLKVLQAMRARPGCRFTFLSSGGTVYGEAARVPVTEGAPCDPTTSYGIMKLAAEKYVGMYSKLYGIDGHVVRISNAYGPLQLPGRGQGVVAALLAATIGDLPAVIFGDGSIVRDYVHSADIARAIASLGELEVVPPVVNVATGVGHSVTEVLDVVEKVTGRPLEVERRADRAFDVRRIVLDVTLLRSLVRWSPVDLETGVESTWEEMTRGGVAELAALRPGAEVAGATQVGGPGPSRTSGGGTPDARTPGGLRLPGGENPARTSPRGGWA